MIKILLLFLAPLLLGTITSRNSIKRNNNRLHRESTNLAEPILKALTNRIAKSLGLDEIPISIHEVKTFNGLATSDGKIFLTRGVT